MVQFRIDEKVIECLGTDTILEVKKEIIKQLDLPCKYIDMSFVLDKPMRVLGKFNVEPGKLPRTLDRYVVERFAFKGEIQVEITEIDNYDPSIKKPLMSGGMGRGRGGMGRGMDSINMPSYVPPSTRRESAFDHSSTELSMDVEPEFNLDSQNDFPSL